MRNDTFCFQGNINRTERGAAAGVTSLARTTTTGDGVCPAALMASNPSRGECLRRGRRHPSPCIFGRTTTTTATAATVSGASLKIGGRDDGRHHRPNSNNTCRRRAAISQLYIRYTPGAIGVHGLAYTRINSVGTTPYTGWALHHRHITTG